MGTQREGLMAIFNRLYGFFGPQHWWPGKTPFEVCLGAILTQNTAWKNVEKCIKTLEENGLLDPARLSALSITDLALLIRPAGYYNIKARRIKSFLNLLMEDFGGDLEGLFSLGPIEARERLLSVHGIGPETADSMLLYAGNLPVFVVDAYTFRVLQRHDLIWEDATYNEVQGLFERNLDNDVKLFNEFHALFVAVGKNFCRKHKPRCKGCPLNGC